MARLINSLSLLTYDPAAFQTSGSSFSPTSGSTIVIPASLGDQVVYINSATVLSALTINFSVINNARIPQQIMIVSKNAVTNLTLTGATFLTTYNTILSAETIVLTQVATNEWA